MKNNDIDQTTLPKGIRILQIVLGSIAFVLSLVIIISPEAGIESLIFLLSVTLLIIGFETVATGTLPVLKMSSRIVNIILGVLTIILGIVVIAFPLFATMLLVYLLSFGLFSLGVARIYHGAANSNIPKWSRALLIGVGILSLAVSITVLVYPVLGILLMTFILAVNLLIIGVESIALGMYGRKTLNTYSASDSSRR